MANQPLKLSVVLSLMEQGYTRLEKDAYEPNKSLEKFLDLTALEKDTLFNHPKVKGVRVKPPVPVIEIIDDLDTMIEDDLAEENGVDTTPVAVQTEIPAAEATDVAVEAALDAVEADEEAVFA